MSARLWPANAALEQHFKEAAWGKFILSSLWGPMRFPEPRRCWRQLRGQSGASLCMGNEALRFHTNEDFLLQARLGCLLENQNSSYPLSHAKI